MQNYNDIVYLLSERNFGSDDRGVDGQPVCGRGHGHGALHLPRLAATPRRAVVHGYLLPVDHVGLAEQSRYSNLEQQKKRTIKLSSKADKPKWHHY